MSLLTEASLVILPNAVKEGELLSIIPVDGSGDMTAVRATTATLVNSEGVIEDVAINVPRLDYTNGSCPSILVEPQRTNLLLRSEEFDVFPWVTQRSTISTNTTISPTGNLTADTFNLSNVGQNIYSLFQTGITSSSLTNTFSIYVKYTNRRYIQLTWFSAFSTNFANFDLITGTITGGTYLDAKINNSYDGFFRISITSTGDSTNAIPYIWPIDTFNAPRASTSDGIGSYILFGAQLEAGSYATSYIPTVASAVTRNADVISKTGLITNNFLSATGGTWFVDLSDIKYISGATSLYIGEGGNNKLTFGGDFSTQSLRVWLYNNSIEYSLYLVPFAQRQKIAFSFTLSQLKIFVNGDLVFTRNASLNCNLWTNFFNDNGSFSCRQNSMMFFNTQLTDQECIELTTL